MRAPTLAFLIILHAIFGSMATHAGEDGYICQISEVRVLSDNGTLLESDEHSKLYEDRSFSIDRNTGAMIGVPFSTSAFKSISVLNRGNADSSYKAMASSQTPEVPAMYMYVAEHLETREKPFWGTAAGTQIYSGICE